MPKPRDFVATHRAAVYIEGLTLTQARALANIAIGFAPDSAIRVFPDGKDEDTLFKSRPYTLERW